MATQDDRRRSLEGLEVVAAPRGCQPGGQSGLQSADAIVGQVDVGDVAV